MMPAGMLATFKGITAEGDRVAVEVEADGTTASGKNYHNSYHFLFQLRDGEIVAVREYMDTLHLFDVLQP
jgi:ketosteroid isomerase-like protein